MSKRLLGLLIIAIGVLVFIVSLTADYIGIGSYPGFNYAQIAGMAIGLVLLIVGAILRLRKPIQPE